MSDSTRRGFLAVAGLGTVGGVAALAAPGAAATEPPKPDLSVPRDAPGAMAAYVRDVRAGHVVLMVEGHEVVVTDHALAAQLARAFARAGRA
jgi:hypothetical protein